MTSHHHATYGKGYTRDTMAATADSQMEWAGRMNNIRSAVEEIVNTEIIFT